jgi:hypothetical protein
MTYLCIAGLGLGVAKAQLAPFAFPVGRRDAVPFLDAHPPQAVEVFP